MINLFNTEPPRVGECLVQFHLCLAAWGGPWGGSIARGSCNLEWCQLLRGWG